MKFEQTEWGTSREQNYDGRPHQGNSKKASLNARAVSGKDRRFFGIYQPDRTRLKNAEHADLYEVNRGFGRFGRLSLA